MLDVYVGNLSGRVSANDLRELFDAISGQKSLLAQPLMVALLARIPWAQHVLSFFRKNPQDAELHFTMVDPAQGQATRYCRVTGYTRSSASRLIHQLKGAGLQGRPLEVRPFYLRSLTNDPRRAGWRFHRWLGVERRTGERRYEKQR